MSEGGGGVMYKIHPLRTIWSHHHLTRCRCPIRRRPQLVLYIPHPRSTRLCQVTEEAGARGKEGTIWLPAWFPLVLLVVGFWSARHPGSRECEAGFRVAG
ncbi:hypothetical protein LY76DRAFT_345263 [Colletotrichum caudatum]|nr:hypothetical protein LY76DRAFT_345263 [Colletotrichum caudatum]